MTKTAPTVAIIGLGSFGMSLADALHAGGIVIDEIIVRPKNLSNRTVQSQARRFGARLSALSNAELHAQVVWICTPDDTIRGVAGRVAPRLTAKQVILHSSGALGSDILRGGPAAKASAHPMMSFARGKVTSLQKVAFAVEGDRRGAVAAAKLIRRCGADFFRISSEHKTLSCLRLILFSVVYGLACRRRRDRKNCAAPFDKDKKAEPPHYFPNAGKLFRSWGSRGFNGPLAAWRRRHDPKPPECTGSIS